MAASGFVLVPDQTHALNQLPAAMNADGSAVMNTVQQLAGAIGTAVASTLIAEFSAANRVAGMKSAAAYVAGFSTSMWVFFGMAVTVRSWPCSCSASRSAPHSWSCAVEGFTSVVFR